MSNEASDQATAAAVFRHAIALFEGKDLDYAVGGGIATNHWTSGVERIGDIDLVVREEDGPRIMSLLRSHGYQTEEMEHSWLHKAFKDDVTVDLMFELKNGTRIDDRFLARRKKDQLLGTMAYIMSAEDQLASLAGTVDRQTIGQHWYSMIDIMSNNDLEWDYVIARAKDVPYQMLSIIYFAMSQNVPVQKGVIEQLEQLASKKTP